MTDLKLLALPQVAFLSLCTVRKLPTAWVLRLNAGSSRKNE